MCADVFVHKPECTSAPKSALNGCRVDSPQALLREALSLRKRVPGETDERRTDRERGEEPRAEKEGFDKQNTPGENERLIETTSGLVLARLSLTDLEMAPDWQAP